MPQGTQPARPEDGAGRELDLIVKRLEKGESKLIEESKALGHPNNDPLRAVLREYLGGPDKYRAMIERGMEARRQAKTNGKPEASKKGGKKGGKKKSKGADTPAA